ncbi:hypothetical protein KBI52_05660 [Microvirga sp. HBU67558]|uniref:DUF6894 family protein n=1 Tax=Microvirga TaxID=186650 RepID=UPI001B37A177|nr:MULTISPECIES: hypothetical protein [unclassified Microvirga]MBQ0819705.1 hypothetical protein [Microvirga sp. HBU67558]
MPRFYFDVWEGAECMPDPEGLELDSLEAAEHEATQTVLTLGRDWLPRAWEVRVEVRDEQSQMRLTLRVTLTVERPG